MFELNNIKYETNIECFLSLFEKFKKENPTTDLYYVDDTDNLSEEQLQSYIHDWCMDIYEHWELWYTIDYYLHETFTTDEIDWLNDNDYMQDIYDYIYEVDKSTPEEDLLAVTKQYQLRYYTGIHIYEDSDNLNEELRSLWLKVWINKKAISNLREWNYYWWELQILFQPNYQDLMNAIYNDDWKQYIEFTDPCVWLCDTSWGSGWYSDFIWTIKLPFNKDNIFVWTAWPWYSLVEVYWDRLLWDSKWKIKKTRNKMKHITNPDVEMYAKLDADLKKWICHSHDERWKSHDYEYDNSWYCWWTCKKCWRFVAD